MRHVLVTGANKGIGLAIVEAILAEHEGTFVHLAARDVARGQHAADELAATHADRRDRLAVVALDVADDASVAAARAAVEARLGGGRLHGIVNNAGIGTRSGALVDVVQTNVLGIHRVCEAFRPLLAPGGRIVNVTSASGPMFVAQCSPERKKFFLDPALAWPALRDFIDACIAAAGDDAALAALGVGSGDAYGLSKACANAYTAILARELPDVAVNACTPGYIATDMTLPAGKDARSAAELGMKTPADGARAPLHLLFGELEGNGRYYGSDAKRSPLDRYRAPGDAEYTGA